MTNKPIIQNFGIIGGGAWGTALAMALTRAGRNVTLWAREPEVADTINKDHENKLFLPGIKLETSIRATNSLGDLSDCEALMLVVPVQHMRDICAELSKLSLKKTAPIIICSKGIERNTLKMPGEIVSEVLPSHILAILSGPTFAAEIARDQPAAITLACADIELGKTLAQSIGSRTFRPYMSDDIIGAEIGGAIKNVLAIACGIVYGRNMGDNARAAIITRGLAEVMRLGSALGGKNETMMGLSGIGDLILTCTSQQSRNTSLGFALGQGKTLSEIMAERNSVAEGVHTAAAAAALANKKNIDAPIIAAVDAILNKNADITETVFALLSRPLKSEA